MLKAVVDQIGRTARSIGQRMDTFGSKLEGNLTYIEHLNLSTKLVRNAGKKPKLNDIAYIAPDVSVIGDVHIGKGSSVWYGVTIRGDVNHIRIGESTNIQDQTVVHVAKIAEDIPTIIGDNVTIEPHCIIHACTIENDCIIGTGAKVLDGAKIHQNSIVAAGSLVPKHKIVPSGQLWSGIPAKHIRDLTNEEIQHIKNSSKNYMELANAHYVESRKSFEQLIEEETQFSILNDFGADALEEYKNNKNNTITKDKGLFFNE